MTTETTETMETTRTTEFPELIARTPYLWRAGRPESAFRLICLPHAGAGAAAYADWARLLPPEIELVAVQLPGRQNRIAEDPFTEVGPLVTTLTHALRPVLDRPYAFFGHSCGAALAFELAKAVRARGRRGPEHLFLSAQASPEFEGTPQLHQLDDDAFRAEMVALGGIDEEILRDESVMRSLIPVLRTDFTLWERHRTAPAEPLDCPITVLCGDSDPRTPTGSVTGWGKHTGADFSVRFYPGGHFYFLESGAGDVVSFLSRQLLGAPVDGRTS
ncbi:thioesterase II family protein [Streptomyces yaizuensis]|uniref:Alpha/beta fold hydrolase n=1 Tax=Streptomyces yaizuensis TaxID=2989713 RepID=A0ABQ5P9I0_9ACTN|nr:alpha/beta fold hydrolase [Streptomyces sp. YSPA8]GLF99155.1 alpha/beta fold hydrolase [Streptomyces sp. YSPA8]